MRASDKNLTVLSEAERIALYGLPDFDDFQRAEYFALTEAELALAQWRRGVSEQLLCMLQIGYFKAKQAFFKVSLAEAPREDIDFLLRSYFPGEPFSPRPVRQAEYYVQRGEIAGFYGYRLWSEAFTPQLAERAADLALRDVTPAFLLTELLAFLNHQKIVRPGYTTLQALIAEALAAERRRLGGLIDTFLEETDRNALQQLLVREDTLSGLAAIKHFGYRMIVAERHKRATLESAYPLAKTRLPQLGISQQNLGYYASLVHYYTIYDLRRLKPGQTHLYLLVFNDQGKATGVCGDRYEFWVYHQVVRKRLLAGELYLDDSLHHRRFSDELITPERTIEVLGALDIPWSRQPLDTRLDGLFADIDRLWRTFDRELRRPMIFPITAWKPPTSSTCAW